MPALLTGPHAAGSSVASSCSVCADTNGMAVNVGFPPMRLAIRLVMASTTILGGDESVGPGPWRGSRGGTCMSESTVPMSALRPSAHSLAAEAAGGGGGEISRWAGRQGAPGRGAAPTNGWRNIKECKAEPQEKKPKRKDESEPRDLPEAQVDEPGVDDGCGRGGTGGSDGGRGGRPREAGRAAAAAGGPRA